jgi:uncharacterized protein
LKPSISYREPWVDALRALALLGVFVVNAMGYPFAPDFPIHVGAPNPVDSPVALVLNSLLVIFVLGKAWPLLCLLFGYSLCLMALKLQADGVKVSSVLHTRYFKLLVVGIIHGIFVYFGDILTVYAVCGLLVSNFVLKRPAKVLKFWKWLSIINIVLLLPLLIGVVAMLLTSQSFDSSVSIENEIILNNGKFAKAADLSTFLAVNMDAYFNQLVSSIYILPLVFWLMFSGILMCRFKLFSDRSYAKNFWKKYLGRLQLLFAILLNISLGILAINSYSDKQPNTNNILVVSMVALPAGIWLIATMIALGMRHRHRLSRIPDWMLWLAPAGKHTLAMYLTLSFSLMLTSGAFLNIQGSTVVRLMTVMLAWVCAIWLAKLASKRGLKDPIASWISANSINNKSNHSIKIREN